MLKAEPAEAYDTVAHPGQFEGAGRPLNPISVGISVSYGQADGTKALLSCTAGGKDRIEIHGGARRLFKDTDKLELSHQAVTANTPDTSGISIKL